LPQATSLAAEIESTLGIKPELIVGKGGCFEVKANGNLVFSKNEIGRFPQNSEVVEPLGELAKEA